MELSLVYYTLYGAPMIFEKFPDLQNRIAVGLVGEGSECLGFDDDLSRDHDWGPSFCIWLSKADYERFGSTMQLEYNKLPQSFEGYTVKNQSDLSNGRRGVFEIGSFFKKYIGLDRPPVTLREWRAIPESNLSVVTNGRVFSDASGEFTQFRDKLKAYYPDDVLKKKLAARCALAAQSGQYNYGRLIRRSEFVAASCALSAFIEASISAVFLLNRYYKPFYKWMHRALKGLPILGAEVYDLLSKLAEEGKEDVFNRRLEIIESISKLISGELIRQGMSRSSSDFLLDHAVSIQEGIFDSEIRAMHVMSE